VDATFKGLQLHFYAVALNAKECISHSINFKERLLRLITDAVYTLYMYNVTYICLKLIFSQLWLVDFAGCIVFWPFFCVNLCENFGKQFLSRPIYVVNQCCLGSISSTFYVLRA